MLGEILARFSPEMPLPALDVQIVICTDGTMTLSLPAMVNVRAWCRISPADASDDAAQPSSFAAFTGLSAFMRQVTEDNPVISVSYSDGYASLAPEYATDSPDEIQAILDAALQIEIGSVSDMAVTDWDPVLRVTSADGQCWFAAFNGHWLTKDGVNYNLLHDEAFWAQTARLRQADDAQE